MIETLSAGDALARELQMLDQVSRNADLRELWFWQSTQSLVVPRKLSTHDRFTQAARLMKDEGWPVFVRGTGGDVTPQGAGVVNVTHVFAAPLGRAYEIGDAYEDLCAPIERALGAGATRGWQPGAFCDGAHNVQWQGKKFAGTAMRFRPCKDDRGRRAVLAHALMLFEPPSDEAIGALNRFLGLLDQDRVIAKEAHAALPETVTPDRFIAKLREEFDHTWSRLSAQ